MTWILPIIASITILFVVIMVTYLMGLIIPPLYDVVQSSNAVADVGFDTGAEAAVRLGTKYIPMLLLLALIFWLLFLKLRRDAFLGQTPGGGRRR